MNLPPNSNYSIDGTERYVNSGWLWPPGLAPPGPPLTNFTITFEKPRVICIFMQCTPMDDWHCRCQVIGRNGHRGWMYKEHRTYTENKLEGKDYLS